MKPIRVVPTKRVFHRYEPDEMSGPLPVMLYKVLRRAYAQRLVEHGEMKWSTLTWFQHFEEVGRGDYCEGQRRYFPVNGLDINRLERSGLPDNTRIILPEHGLVSRAAASHHIFIYSMTLDPALDIGDAADRVCVQIFDPPLFIRRIAAAIGQHRNARLDTFIHDVVRYWAASNPPEEVWALPNRLTMHKREEYRPQSEYRLAFGIRPNVFDFEHVECFVVDKATRWPRLTLDEQRHSIKLRVGCLTDCCSLMPC